MVVGELIEELLHLIGGPILADDFPLFSGEGLRRRRHFSAFSNPLSAGPYSVVWKMPAFVITDANILWTPLLVGLRNPHPQIPLDPPL